MKIVFVNDMADAVVALLRDPELAGRLSDHGRRLAETFSWERTRPEWERLIHGTR